jgi:hypothetical protein
LKSIGQQIKILERLQHISDGRTNGRTPSISISPAPLCGGGGQKGISQTQSLLAIGNIQNFSESFFNLFFCQTFYF